MRTVLLNLMFRLGKGESVTTAGMQNLIERADSNKLEKARRDKVRPGFTVPAAMHGCGLAHYGITLTGRSITMQITTKGQVTIPQEIRNRLGLLPHTRVEFEMAGDHARIRKARRPPGESIRGRLALEALRGTADIRMSTDEILALTRGGPRATTRRK